MTVKLINTGKEASFINSNLTLDNIQETGIFTGYASVFDDIDNVKDKVAKGAFKNSLNKHRAKNRMPPLLWQHDVKEPIGVFREIREDKKGLFVKAELFINEIARAKQAYKLMTENALTGLSIGFKTVNSEIDAMTGVRTLLEVDLLEISIVTFPALDSARISAVKNMLGQGKLPEIKEFEAYLRDAGFSRKQAKLIIAKGYREIISQRDVENYQNPNSDVALLARLTRKLQELSY